MFDSMHKTVLGAAAALTVGLVSPAAAAVLDFTADNATSGMVLGTTWTVTASPGSLTNSLHGNNVGCSGQGWDFACSAVGSSFDVGFGVSGNNGNEIDGNISVDEYVQVAFGTAVKVTGFAGMLTYANTSLTGDREQVMLEYRLGAGSWMAILADPLFIVNEAGGSSFNTVGLGFRDGLSLFADTVRFKGTGIGGSDDGSFNVTAAGLTVAAVPVPAAGFLLIGALGGLAVMRRRKAA